MKYSSLASSNRNYQSSVNLQFDLNKKNKIDSYIPTQQSVTILKRYLNAIYNTGYNEDNATVLIGPYGRGKSHLLLVMSQIMSGENDAVDKECLDDLFGRIAHIDNETAELARMITDRKKLMLPVIINSNYSDINQSFILALREALDRAELTDLFPETYFDSAISMINTWEHDYENAYKTFTKLLKEKKTTPGKLKEGLAVCGRDEYILFCEIYPKITNGAEFNPMQNTDVVKMYSKTAAALCEQKNYCGIYIIFDEFSKFLESAAANQNMQNFKLIQDFAELAARSGDVQIHICCVTHKEILDYSQNESFRTVDGRFKKVYFVASSEQSYELVANAIEHSNKFERFYNKHREQFDMISQSAYRTNVFKDLCEEKYESIIVRNCFPLHPITVYALIRVSELVGQNERTLFTFLSQTEEHTLSDFLSKDRDDTRLYYLTIDSIFDYFSELFRIEVFDPRIHSIWAKTNTALKQTDDPNQRKILKTIAVINIINDVDFIPVSNNIKSAVNMSDEDYNYSIEQLTRSHILTIRRNGQYAFLTPNGVDIRKTIRNYIEQGLVRLDRPAILKNAYSVPYILPRQYNSDRCMMRYFRTTFMEAKDLCDYNGDFSELMNGADGIIIHLITDKAEERSHIEQRLSELDLPANIIVCVSECWIENDLLNEYSAACMLEGSKAAEDIHFRDELLIYKEDLFKSIQEISNRIYTPSNPNTAYYNEETCLEDVTKPMLLNRELSRICSVYYSNSPVVNNEMINKDHLTAQIKKARAKAIDWILEHPDKIPQMEGYGPEVSVFRSAISVMELDKADTSKDNDLTRVLEIINEYIAEGERRFVSFAEIFDCLTAAPYGMRKGIIPIYIAYVMRKYRDRIVVYLKNKEIELSGEIFNNIDDSPSDHGFNVEVGTKERNDFLDAVIKLFSDDENNAAVNKRNMATSLMQAWFRGLPKFSRIHQFIYDSGSESKQVPQSIDQLRKKLLMYDVNPYDFMFRFIPEIFECDDCTAITKYIIDFVGDSKNFISEFKLYLAKRVKKLFNSKMDGSLFAVMKDWYDRFSDRTKKNVFDADTNAVIKFIVTNTDYDDSYVVSALAKSITMLAVEDWSDDTVVKFIDSITRVIDIVNNYENMASFVDEQQVSISLSIDGKKYERSLDDTEISPMAETTLSNIEEILNEYADSITAQEKISVLLKLLKKEIDNI